MEHIFSDCSRVSYNRYIQKILAPAVIYTFGSKYAYSIFNYNFLHVNPFNCTYFCCFFAKQAELTSMNKYWLSLNQMIMCSSGATCLYAH